MRFANFFEDLIEKLRIKKIERYNLRQIKRAEIESKKLQNSSSKSKSRFSSFSKPFFGRSNYKSANYALPTATQNAVFRYRAFYNRFFNPISWFSQKSTSGGYKSVWHALKSHIRYIADPKRKDLELAEGLELDKWKAITESEISRRWDARIAGKFFLTLPNELTAEQALQLVKSFVENEIQSANIGIAIHRNKGILEGKDNLHAHVVFSARRKDGKKVRLNRKDLSELQRKWDEYLTRAGFEVKTAPWRRQVKAKDFWQDGKINEDVVRYVKTQRSVWALLTKAVNEEKVFRESQSFERKQNQERERENQERERRAMKIRQEEREREKERERERKEQERKEQERKEEERRQKREQERKEQERRLEQEKEKERKQRADQERERRRDQERERREQEIREVRERIKKREEERRLEQVKERRDPKRKEKQERREQEKERERKPTTYQGRENQGRERREEQGREKRENQERERREGKPNKKEEQRKELFKKILEEKLKKLQEQQARQRKIDLSKKHRIRLE